MPNKNTRYKYNSARTTLCRRDCSPSGKWLSYWMKLKQCTYSKGFWIKAWLLLIYAANACKWENFSHSIIFYYVGHDFNHNSKMIRIFFHLSVFYRSSQSHSCALYAFPSMNSCQVDDGCAFSLWWTKNNVIKRLQNIFIKGGNLQFLDIIRTFARINIFKEKEALKIGNVFIKLKQWNVQKQVYDFSNHFSIVSAIFSLFFHCCFYYSEMVE